jgi:hypothetical protein
LENLFSERAREASVGGEILNWGFWDFRDGQDFFLAPHP